MATKKANPAFTRSNSKRRSTKKARKRVTEKEKEISDMLIAQKEAEKKESSADELQMDSKASNVDSGTSTPVASSDALGEASGASTDNPVKEEPAPEITEADRLVAAQRKIIQFLMGKRNANHNERRTIRSILLRSERYLQTVDRGLL